MDQAESANSTGIEEQSTQESLIKDIKQEPRELTLVIDDTNNNGNNDEDENDDDDDDVNGDADADNLNDTRMKRSVYDAVIGANDQELARRQYSDDDDVDYENCSPRTKRFASESNNSKRAIPTDDPDQYNNNNNKSDNTEQQQQQQQQNSPSSNDNNLVTPSNGSHNGACVTNGSPSLNGGVHENATSQGKPVSQSADEPEQVRKLFIGGLDYKTSEETLRVHFEKFGDVTDCVVMREPQTKRSRGFGFVIYANSSMVDKAQYARPHEVDGREVQSKRAISREDSGKPEAQATVKKVYLGGLSDDIEEAELRDYFRKFGNIVNINIVAHKDTGKRRGFAFLEFDDYDPVDKIVLKKYHTIKDKRIEAKKAIPKVEMDARKRTDPRAGMAGAMMALSGPPLDAPNGRSRGPAGGRNGAAAAAAAAAAACLWDSPYGAGYPGNYPGQAALDGYPPHYHSPSGHYGASSWMMHQGAGQGVYGNFRGSHGANGGGAYGGRNSYGGQPVGGGWSSAVDYDGLPGAAQGGVGPMRLGYQHRSWAPYGGGGGSYGPHRSRGYNP